MQATKPLSPHPLVCAQEGDATALPAAVLEGALNRPVQVLLKDQRIFAGRLLGFDDHMNMILEGTQETLSDGATRSLGTLVLRGNNIVSLSPR